MLIATFFEWLRTTNNSDFYQQQRGFKMYFHSKNFIQQENKWHVNIHSNACCWCKINRWNRGVSTQINPCIHTQLIYDKRGISVQWGQLNLNKRSQICKLHTMHFHLYKVMCGSRDQQSGHLGRVLAKGGRQDTSEYRECFVC